MDSRSDLVLVVLWFIAWGALAVSQEIQRRTIGRQLVMIRGLFDRVCDLEADQRGESE